MNATTTFPASVHEKYLGIVQLARTIDKAKMVANGTIGENKYDCSMDQALFTEFGIDAKKLSAVVSDAAKNDSHRANVEAYVKPLVQKKSAQEIERFNHDTVTRKPTGEGLEHFQKLRTRIAPDRTDVTSWADLLDLEEGRAVPKRTSASN
jgi:hypothetical protein